METQKTSGKSKNAVKGCGACALIFLFLVIVAAIGGGEDNASSEPEKIAETQTIEAATEDQIKEAFIKEFSLKNNSGDERVRGVYIWQDDDGTSWVTIDYNADENLTANMMRSSMWRDAVDFYEKVTPLLSKNFNGAVLSGWLKTTDAYGKVDYTKAMTITMERPTWEKITWESFLSDNIPVVADVYVESPIFRN
jgi:hypothetical protein